MDLLINIIFDFVSFLVIFKNPHNKRKLVSLCLLHDAFGQDVLYA